MSNRYGHDRYNSSRLPNVLQFIKLADANVTSSNIGAEWDVGAEWGRRSRRSRSVNCLMQRNTKWQYGQMLSWSLCWTGMGDLTIIATARGNRVGLLTYRNLVIQSIRFQWSDTYSPASVYAVKIEERRAVAWMVCSWNRFRLAILQRMLDS